MIKISKISKFYLVITILMFSIWIIIINKNNIRLSELVNEIETLEVENNNLYNDNIIYKLKLDKLNEKIKKLDLDLKKSKNEKVVKTSRGRNIGEFTVTCYDLSVQSCGKPIGSKGYGITASGVSLVGESWESARAIAVDPKVIPLGSEVEIVFSNPNYSKYNGVYTAVDTGGAIKGNKIDFFLGDFNQNESHQSVWDFGKTKANIKIIK